MSLSAAQVKHIQQQIIAWQANHGRHDLPWQQSVSPYRVHVSEIMLQQTQVATVIPYFNRWIESFPTIEALASASEDEVMAHWQGLGYYSRARNLRKAALHLMQHHGGEYPNDLNQLNALPGVGQYTAGAIRSFAFNHYGPIVDGNVKRLYARLFAVSGDPSSSAFNKQMWLYANHLTPPKSSKVYSQGVLDLGATLCKKHNPDCIECPLQSDCLAYATGTVAQLPNVKKRKAKPTKYAHFFWQYNQHSIYLIKRASPGIWGGLWCLPELTEEPSNGRLIGNFNHEFSHYRLEASVWAAQENQVAELSTAYVDDAQKIVAIDDLAAVGLPTPIKQFIHDRILLDQ